MKGREQPSHSGEVLLVRMHSGHWWKGGPLPVNFPQSQQRRGPLVVPWQYRHDGPHGVLEVVVVALVWAVAMSVSRSWQLQWCVGWRHVPQIAVLPLRARHGGHWWCGCMAGRLSPHSQHLSSSVFSQPQSLMGDMQSRHMPFE